MRFLSIRTINNLIALSAISYILEVMNVLDNYWYLRILFIIVNMFLIINFLQEIRWSEIQWTKVFSRTSRTNFLIFLIPSIVLLQILAKDYFWEGAIARQVLMLSFVLAMVLFLLAGRSPFHIQK